ncbi:HPr Serine kinase C-terminal domain-containing protein [Lutimaribacter pacificus]|uniref:Hpr(Ser) kinase/phosphatase n=2 Tax=Lutimaribacter pacificus TaxID=391948 RepID=A0A1H0I3K7_9RHOB|nr:serine kinase [Lutimaribacter pacificus]SDO25720.1 HPr Serine kinase C-terminal domain-containing protein [Lutimaribacter pacificus]SHK27470.1 Hpr(Ser) kinase/phosphatase [Lutimaribacter pacificus]
MAIPAHAPAAGDPGSDARTPLHVHASTVAVGDAAVLVSGRAGSGKSALALQLMAMGADLVADDITCLWCVGDGLLADVPEAIRGRIEARGVGILNAAPRGPVPMALWVDLDTPEAGRLPPRRTRAVLGCEVPLFHNPGTGCFSAAIVQYLRYGRYA